MKHLLLFILFCIGVTLKTSAQLQIEWSRLSDDGTQGEYYQQKLLNDSLGSFYCLGRNKSSLNTKTDIMIVKYDSLGNEIWKQIYSRPGDRTETISGATIDHNGDIIFTGECFNNNNVADILIGKYSSSGQLLWADSIDGTSGMYDKGIDVCVDDSNNIFLTGYIFNTVFKGFLAKYSSSGQKQFLTILSTLQQGRGITFKNNRILLYGITGMAGNPAHTELFKLDPFGAIQNSYSINDAYSNNISSLLEDNQFIYLVDNRGSNSGGYSTYSVHCVDTSLNFIWKSDQTSNNHLGAINLTQHDSSLYVSANHTVNATAFLTELDFRQLRKSDGALISQALFNNSPAPTNYYAQHIMDSQGNMTVGMMSNGNPGGNMHFQIARYDKNLQYQGLTLLPDSIAGGNISLLQVTDHTLLWGSQTINNNGNNDLLLTKLSDIQVGLPLTFEDKEIKIYPNPSREYLNLESSLKGKCTWEIFNLQGVLLTAGELEGSTMIYIRALPCGNYKIKVTNALNSYTSTLIKIE